MATDRPPTPSSRPPAPSPAAAATTPERLMGLAHGYWTSQILAAAAARRFFTHIAQGRRTAEAVAVAAGTDPRGTRMVLDSLVGLQVLAKRDGRYELTPEADAFLVEGRPGDLSAAVTDQMDLLWQTWGRLREALSTGKPVQGVDDVARAKEFFPKLIRSLMPLGLRAADAAAEHLGVGTRWRGLEVLDIGAGAAAWSIPFARRDAAGRVTALDLPEVIAHTVRIVEEQGVGGRFRMMEGDYRTVDLGAGIYHLAILGNICHIESPEVNRDLFRRIRRALQAGGRLLIADMLPNEDRSGPPFPLMFAVNMLLHAEKGDTYTLSQYREWLADAGFSEVSTFDSGRSHSPVIIAAVE